MHSVQNYADLLKGTRLIKISVDKSIPSKSHILILNNYNQRILLQKHWHKQSFTSADGNRVEKIVTVLPIINKGNPY